jgi:hypothetical protein
MISKLGRPIKHNANTEAIKKLSQTADLVDLRPIIAYTMRHSGCTLAEIANVFDISKQRVHAIVKTLEAEIGEVLDTSRQMADYTVTSLETRLNAEK